MSHPQSGVEVEVGEGEVAGIWLGRSGIPAQWLAKVRGAAIVEPLVMRLIDGLRAAATAPI